MKSALLDALAMPESTTRVRVLMLEHEPQDAELMLLELKACGYEVEYRLAENKEEFLAALKDGAFDAILADYRLPSWTGLDALKEVRASGKDIPFLLVTGTIGEEAAVECLKQGVNDYILKGHLRRLPGALKRAMQEKNLRDENARANKALAESEARARE